jgi:hypothetical protein
MEDNIEVNLKTNRMGVVWARIVWVWVGTSGGHKMFENEWVSDW